MSVEKSIRHYQRSVEKSTHDADRMLHCVTKLYHLPITVQHLQDTGVGRTINGLRKYDGPCGEAAKACVAKWKAMVAAEESSDPETENVDASTAYEEAPIVENSHVYSQLQGTSSSRHHKEEVKTNGTHRKHHSEHTSKTKDDSNKSKKLVEEVHSLKHKERTAHSAKAAKEIHPTTSGSSSSKTHQKSSKDTKISSKSSSSSKSENGDSSKHSRSKVSTSEESSDGRDVDRKPKAGGSNSEKSQSGERSQNREKNTKVESRSCKSDSLSESLRPGSSHSRGDKPQSREKKVKIESLDDGIDCLSGASFAEALGMVSPVKRRSSPSTSSPHKGGSSRKNPSPQKSKLADTGSAKEFDFLSLSSPTNLSPLPLALELPAIDPNYRPLPEPVYDEARRRKVKPLSEEEALSKVMYHRAERTRVFSGVKAAGYRRGEPPTLFDACLRVLGDNIDYLGYTGGVPFAILEPVLKRATPEQLFELERHNPYLLDDTDALWEFHCNKRFRSMKLEEMESYREMYMRGLDERAAKLQALTSNIKLSQAASVPVRQAKLTYMDTVAKPPREVARQQARHGTARPQVGPSRVRPVSPAASASSANRTKKRVAPLMQKTMKFAKTFKR